jgi:hypothetical protein
MTLGQRILAAKECVRMLAKAKSSGSSQMSTFDGGSTVVEIPDGRWGEVQVGNPASVVVAFELEQRLIMFSHLDQSAGKHMASGFQPNGNLAFALGWPLHQRDRKTQPLEAQSESLRSMLARSVFVVLKGEIRP